MVTALEEYIMLTKNKREYLEKVYFTPGQPGAFGGINRVWNVIKNDGKVSKKELKTWLLEQETYTSHRQFRRKFKRPRVVVPYTDAVWGSDTAYMIPFQEHNDGYGYFAVFIDLFSKYAFTYPLKSLQGKEMVKVIETLFEDAGTKCEKLFTDNGSEFQNRWVKAYLKSEDVHHYTSKNEKKVSISERLIKQLKKLLIKYMDQTNTRRWIDVLGQFTNQYNHSYNRSIQMTPAQARTSDQHTVWTNQYYSKPVKKKVGKPRNKSAYKINVGDRVKLLAEKKPFDREYSQLFTTEVFTIIDRMVKDGIALYKIKDEQNDPIIGTFYEKELQKVIVPDDKLYKIEKVIRTRKRRGKKEYLVKFQGYPSKFNAWVTDIYDI